MGCSLELEKPIVFEGTVQNFVPITDTVTGEGYLVIHLSKHDAGFFIPLKVAIKNNLINPDQPVHARLEDMSNWKVKLTCKHFLRKGSKDSTKTYLVYSFERIAN
jgi:hypothetical protein